MTTTKQDHPHTAATTTDPREDRRRQCAAPLFADPAIRPATPITASSVTADDDDDDIRQFFAGVLLSQEEPASTEEPITPSETKTFRQRVLTASRHELLTIASEKWADSDLKSHELIDYLVRAVYDWNLNDTTGTGRLRTADEIRAALLEEFGDCDNDDPDDDDPHESIT